MKLSDTQLLILSSASQRADHTALLPENLKGSAAKKVVDRLLNEKLLQELRAKNTAAVSAKATRASSDQVKPDSKQDRIVALLQSPEGATLDVLVKETQWQKHSVRGFLAGTVRKKLKLPLLSVKIDGVRTYRVGTPKAAKTKKTATARKA